MRAITIFIHRYHHSVMVGILLIEHADLIRCTKSALPKDLSFAPSHLAKKEDDNQWQDDDTNCDTKSDLTDSDDD